MHGGPVGGGQLEFFRPWEHVSDAAAEDFTWGTGLPLRTLTAKRLGISVVPRLLEFATTVLQQILLIIVQSGILLSISRELCLGRDCQG